MGNYTLHTTHTGVIFNLWDNSDKAQLYPRQFSEHLLYTLAFRRIELLVILVLLVVLFSLVLVLDIRTTTMLLVFEGGDTFFRELVSLAILPRIWNIWKVGNNAVGVWGRWHGPVSCRLSISPLWQGDRGRTLHYVPGICRGHLVWSEKIWSNSERGGWTCQLLKKGHGGSLTETSFPPNWELIRAPGVKISRW